MADVLDEQPKRVKCRYAECTKTFSNRSNRDRHEKNVGHAPAPRPRRDAAKQPVFNDALKVFCCPTQNCPVSSKFKSNITRHIKAGCKKKGASKVCPHCKETFAQKSNRDRHIKRFHPTEINNEAEVTAEEVPVPTFDNETIETLNVSILSSDGSTIEQSMREVDGETPIFEIFEPQLNSDVENQASESQMDISAVDVDNQASASQRNISICHDSECNLDNDGEDKDRRTFDFIEVPSFIALVSEDSNEPIYFVKVEEKGIAEKDEEDDFGHTVTSGEWFIRGKYLKKERSRSTRHHKFSMLSGNVLCTPDEVFEVFVNISENLTIEKETFSEILSRVEA